MNYSDSKVLGLDGEKIIGLCSHVHPSGCGTMTTAKVKQRSPSIIPCNMQLSAFLFSLCALVSLSMRESYRVMGVGRRRFISILQQRGQKSLPADCKHYYIQNNTRTHKHMHPTPKEEVTPFSQIIRGQAWRNLLSTHQNEQVRVLYYLPVDVSDIFLTPFGSACQPG